MIKFSNKLRFKFYFRMMLSIFVLPIFMGAVMSRSVLAAEECRLNRIEFSNIINVPIDMGRIVVGLNDPVGKVLASKLFSVKNFRAGAILAGECLYGDFMTINAVLSKNPNLSVLTDSIYDSNIPGIGIRIRSIADPIYRIYGLDGYYPYRREFINNWNVFGLHFEIGLMLDSIEVELFKTSYSIGSGPLEAGQYTRLYQSNYSATPWVTTFMNANGTHIIAPACEIKGGRNHRTVTLAKVSTSSLHGIGTTAGDTAFDLGIQCNAQSSATQLSSSLMNMMIDYVPERNNLKVLLNTAGNNRANGVGLQIIYMGNHGEIVVGRGERIELGVVNSSQNQNFNLLFKVRYYQVRDSVTAGEIQAQATVTFSYL